MVNYFKRNVTWKMLAGILSGYAFLSAGFLYAQPARPIKIVTTFYPLFIMTLNVTQGIPGVEVANLAPSAAGCLHDYSLTTRDMKNLVAADILVVNGAGMESFLDGIMRRFPKVPIVSTTEGMELIKEKGAVNPHVWVSISGAIGQVKNVSLGLARIDPAHAQQYQENAQKYISRLEVLRGKMHTVLSPYRGAKIITFHEAFAYFAQEFGLDVVGVVEREPGSAPNARELAQTIDLVKQQKVKALFTEPQYSAQAAETIARETGARIFVLDPAVTGARGPDAYIDAMEINLKVLEEALR